MPLSPSSEPIEHVELRCDRADLRADWQRCALSSDFIAVAACDVRYGQRVLSAVVNELMELVWRLGAGPGDLELHVRNRRESAEISLSVQLESELAADLVQRIQQLAQDPHSPYLAKLGHTEAVDPLFGLLHVLCDYAARLTQVHCAGPRLWLALDVATSPGVQA